MLFPQSWEAAKQPRLRVLTPIIVSLLHFHDTFYLREEPRQGSSVIEARREGCGLDSSRRGVAGGEEGASKRAKVGLKSTSKGFYCSGVAARLRTCVLQKGNSSLKKKFPLAKGRCRGELMWMYGCSRRFNESDKSKTGCLKRWLHIMQELTQFCPSQWDRSMIPLVAPPIWTLGKIEFYFCTAQ